MVILRKILFYVFLAGYLFLCPTVILYSLGYIYAPKTEDVLIKTGLIRLETRPSGASVYLNDKLVNGKTSCTISELLPARYTVRAELKGHHPWTQIVEVAAGKAAVYENILLLSEMPQTRVLIPTSFQDMSRVPATRFILLFSGEKIGDGIVYDWKNGTFRQLVAENSPYAGDDIQRYFASKGSPFAVFVTRAKKNLRYLWLGLREDDLEVRDITGLFNQGEPEDIRWEGGNPRYLFASYQGRLARLDLENGIVLPEFMKGLRGFGLHKGKVYGLKGDSLVRLNFDSKEIETTVVESGRFLENIFREEGTFRMDFLAGGTVFFIGQNGELISNRLPYWVMKKGFAGYVPDASFKKVLIWTREELGLFDFGKTNRERALFERGPEIDWIRGKWSDVRQAYFMHKDSHIIFCDEKNVRLMELGSEPPRVREIARVRNNSIPFYSEETGELYYLEPGNGYFVAREIIPKEKTLERMFEGAEEQTPQEKR